MLGLGPDHACSRRIRHLANPRTPASAAPKHDPPASLARAAGPAPPRHPAPGVALGTDLATAHARPSLLAGYRSAGERLAVDNAPSEFSAPSNQVLEIGLRREPQLLLRALHRGNASPSRGCTSSSPLSSAGFSVSVLRWRFTR